MSTQLKTIEDMNQWAEFSPSSNKDFHTKNNNSKAIKYVQNNSSEWIAISKQLKEVTNKIKSLQEYESSLRDQIIFLSEGQNTYGAGLSFCEIQRKGNINYSKIPELKDVDLDLYRNEPTTSYRITFD